MDSHIATSAKALPTPTKSAADATFVKSVVAISTKSDAATSAKSVAAAEKSSPIVVAATVISPVPSPTTSGSASHTPSLDIPITSMEVEEVEYGYKDVHRSSSVKDASSMGTRSGRGHGSRGDCPPQPR
jgi:hypothetical protein